jgi:hypothetical protein
MADDPNVRCARCGWRKSTHAVVGGVDAPVLICPTVIFDESGDGPRTHANAVDAEMKNQKT